MLLANIDRQINKQTSVKSNWFSVRDKLHRISLWWWKVSADSYRCSDQLNEYRLSTTLVCGPLGARRKQIDEEKKAKLNLTAATRTGNQRQPECQVKCQRSDHVANIYADAWFPESHVLRGISLSWQGHWQPTSVDKILGRAARWSDGDEIGRGVASGWTGSEGCIVVRQINNNSNQWSSSNWKKGAESRRAQVYHSSSNSFSNSVTGLILTVSTLRRQDALPASSGL